MFIEDLETLAEVWSQLGRSIDLARWGAKARIVAAIVDLQLASDDGVAWISWRNIPAITGVSERMARHLLGPTWQVAGASGPANTRGGGLYRIDRVVHRGAVPRGGHRPTAWAVNPELTAWQNVPWIERNAELRRRELDALIRAAASPQGRAPAPSMGLRTQSI